MALVECPDDVLLNIVSYVYSDLCPIAYIVDFENRRQIFSKLVLVCSRFYNLFTPLLYRTLCLFHEKNTWPAEYEEQWLKQDPRRRVMAALFRTLNLVPAFGRYTHFLEVSWERQDVSIEDYRFIEESLRMFPLLREIDISGPPCPSIGYQWTLEFLDTDFSRHLRKLRLHQPFTPSKLSHIFFLPHLKSLEIAVLDARTIDRWSLPPGAMPGRSPVTSFSITAILDPSQLIQIATWPSSLHHFTYIHQGYPIPNAKPPQAKNFYMALYSFRRTLKSLNVQISDIYYDSPDVVGDQVQLSSPTDHTPYLDLRQFLCLEEFRVPSLLCFGLPGKGYTRNLFIDRLPSSLRILAIEFGLKDPFQLGEVYDGNIFQDYNMYDADQNIAWLCNLGRRCCPWDQFPSLRSVSVTNHGPTTRYWGPDALHRLFQSKNVELDLRTHKSLEDWRYEVDDYEYYRDYQSCGDAQYYLYDENGASIVGEEETQYSDSSRGSEIDEHAMEWEYEDEEFWEHFDKMMAEEWSAKGEKWIKGQYPGYEKTKEERDEVYRYCVRVGS